MKSDMSRRYHTRVVTNIVYSAIITCLVEVFVVANMIDDRPLYGRRREAEPSGRSCSFP